MTSDSHVLVTGGTGFLGSYILRALLSKGYNHIRAIRRPSSRMGLVADIQDRINWIEADLFDFDLLADAMTDVDVVIHSAAIISFVPGQFNAMYKVNVEGTAHMVNAALEKNVKQFLHVSSVAALGRSLDKQFINEESEFEHTKLDTGYGLTKHLAEMEVWRAGSEGLPVTMINPSMIMGAGYWDTGTAKLVDTVFRNLKYYPLGQTGFVDVRDVADMSILMLEQQLMKRRMLCCGANFKIREMIEIISKALDKKPPAIALSPILCGIAWRLEWLRSKLAGTEPLITKETLSTSAHNFSFDNSKSVDQLGFVYRDLRRTMDETCTLYLAGRKSKAVYAVIK